MSDTPKGTADDFSPPQHVSSEGREIWDWAIKLSEASARAHKSRELRGRIAATGTSGVMVGGPSSGTPKCSAFIEKASSAALRSELKSELAALTGASA